MVPDVNGFMQATTDTVETCTGYVTLDSTEFALYQEAIALTPEQVLFLFGWGFGAVIFFWFSGFVIGVAKKGIRSA